MDDELICPHCGQPVPYQYESKYDQAIERFYRMRAHSRHKLHRVTLRRVAEETGIPYSTLTKHKMEYDRLGKWGSKP